MLEPPLLGPLLRERRQALDWSLDQLASESGVSRSMLSQIERGAANPTFATLWNVTQALGVEFHVRERQHVDHDAFGIDRMTAHAVSRAGDGDF